MRRRELRKAVSKYAKEVKFYRYGLIAKYLKHLKKEELKLLNSIPKVKCPFCNSENIEIEYDDCEYSSESWLYCDDCDECFDDEVGFIDKIDEVRCIPYWDDIYNRIHCGEYINFESIKWKEYCEKTILKEISR